MTKNTRTAPEIARQRVNDAVMALVEAIAALENSMYEDLYDRAFNEGVEWFKSELKKIDSFDEPVPVPHSQLVAALTDIEKITDQSVLAAIANNPGWRTSDIMVVALKLPVKPTLTEANVKATINRLKREGKIDNKAGRWYSTQSKASNQKFQVMAYMPDGSKYLGTDVIKENA